MLQIIQNQEAPNYFSVKGNLTHDTCMYFVESLEFDTLHDSLILNISDVQYLDGSGVGVLVTLAICLQHQRKQLVVISPKDTQPGDMLRYLGILKMLGAR